MHFSPTLGALCSNSGAFSFILGAFFINLGALPEKSPFWLLWEGPRGRTPELLDHFGAHFLHILVHSPDFLHVFFEACFFTILVEF